MPTTMEPQVFPSTDVVTTVSLDLTSRQIQIPVISQDGVTIWAPPCAVPGGGWTLLWNMASDVGAITNITFPNTGVSLPQRVSVSAMPTSTNGFQASLDNKVLMVNSFNYTITAQLVGASGTVTHDPSIAVVQDPIG